MLDTRFDVEAKLALRLLGEPEIRFGDRRVRVVNRKLLCLLAYLALIPGGRESRERLVGLLWSESDETRARGSLRQAMTAFRRLCGEHGFEGFESDRGGVGLAPGSLRLDVDEVLEALDAGEVHPALLAEDDLPGRLLKGCEEADPAFRGWLTVQREALRERLLRGLNACLGAASERRDGDEDAARAILRLDATQEAAVRHLMERRARAGDPATALRVYNRLYVLLGEEHDMEPAPETMALVARIKQGGFEAPAAGGGAAAPAAPERGAPLLIVEPFRAPGADPGAQAWLDGFRHGLIARLVRFREWRVAEGLEDDPAPAPAPEGRDRFRVRAMVEPRGEGVAMTLTIREEAGGLYLWSDRFVLTPDAWAESQSRLLRQITMALNVNVSAERMRRLAAAPEVPASLHDRWLQAQRLITAYDPEAWTQAERVLEEVVRAAPDFAPAWSALAQLGHTRHIAYPGVMRSAALHRRTLDYAQRAAALDPLDSRAHATLGWALIFCGRWEPAATNLKLALQLNDHDPWTVTSVAAARAFAGRRDEVQRLAQSVLETAEMSETRRWSLLAGLRFVCEDDEGALEAAARAGRVRANIGAWRAAANARLGRIGEARREADALRAELRRRWRGPGPADERAMTTWLLHMFPMRREKDWRRLRDGLAAAGLAVDHARFGHLPD